MADNGRVRACCRTGNWHASLPVAIRADRERSGDAPIVSGGWLEQRRSVCSMSLPGPLFWCGGVALFECRLRARGSKMIRKTTAASGEIDVMGRMVRIIH